MTVSILSSNMLESMENTKQATDKLHGIPSTNITPAKGMVQRNLLSFFSSPKGSLPKEQNSSSSELLSPPSLTSTFPNEKKTYSSSISGQNLRSNDHLDIDEHRDKKEAIDQFRKEEEEEDLLSFSKAGRMRKRVQYLESEDEQEESIISPASFKPSSKQKVMSSKKTKKSYEEDDFVVDDDDEEYEQQSEEEGFDNEIEDSDMKISPSAEKLKMFTSPSAASSRSSNTSPVFSAKKNTPSKKEQDEQRYHWLLDLRDADKTPIGHPDYDPRTLYIPPSAWSSFTPFEKQFWEIKSKYFDTVVFFKKGKFYELYENDADMGHKEFDLKMTDRVNMRMVGVPEMSFEFWASKFIAAGHKIAKVDQMESALGKSMREKQENSKKENIIRRELTSILTAGTLMDSRLLTSDMATYCMAIKEEINSEIKYPVFGVAFVDTATAEFFMAAFEDDGSRTKFETLLMQTKPKEVIYEKGNLSPDSWKILKNTLNKSVMNSFIPGKEFPDTNDALVEIDLNGYFKGNSNDNSHWPPTIAKMQQKPCVISSLGALLRYLKTLRIDEKLASMKNFKIYDPIQQSSSLVLDGQTLINLEILQNSIDGGEDGTLIKLLNTCVTPFGKRLYKRWLCHPLRSIEDIEERLDAVDDFLRHSDIREDLTGYLLKLPDLERAVARIHVGNCKLSEFLQVIKSLESVNIVIKIIKENSMQFNSQKLKTICAKLPDLTSKIEVFKTAFDHDKAKKEGYITPYKGFDEDFDASVAKLASIYEKFEQYINIQKQVLRQRQLKYKDIGKELYQLEMPADTKVPADYLLMSKTKQVKRYWTQEIKMMVRDLQESEEIKSAAQNSLLSRTLKKFDDDWTLWNLAICCLAELDCLMSLSRSSQSMGEPICRPTFSTSSSCMVTFEGLRHPCISGSLKSNFIPNDLSLGGEADSRMIVLTGPNMGGKSTLLRQTCIGIIMAQLGSYVPARKCQLTPIDRIFTRIGANDNILAGQSTFMVELQETAKILKEATRHSLVILDELGRGTSTFDGYSIAYAVLHHLTTRTGCLGLFSTHYHMLTKEYEGNPLVGLFHMACEVNEERKEVIFLYKLKKGVCPKSYGMNVANMAGVPLEIVQRAERIAHDFEVLHNFHEIKTMKKQSDIPTCRLADFSTLWHVTDLGGHQHTSNMNDILVNICRSLKNN